MYGKAVHSNSFSVCADYSISVEVDGSLPAVVSLDSLAGLSIQYKVNNFNDYVAVLLFF